MLVRPAILPDVQAIMTVLEAAKGIMRASGNLHQWVNGYPSAEVIRDDIDLQQGYVLEEDARVVGYFTFMASPEPTYDTIYRGAWLDDERPYHVIHRIASLPDVHGVFTAIMDFAFAHDGNIRVDTHKDNHIMQHNLLKHGFSYCGIIYLSSGDPRLAYQKLTT
jgi:hypothetical protein